jgi:perosamine synthetase
LIALGKPDLSGKEREYLLRAFDSGYLTHQGEWEDRFEEKFAAYIGRSAMATSSGTGALHCALMALGVGPGDEVIVPALTFGAVASVVVQCGAKPVLIDVEDNFCIDTTHILKKTTRRTKAIIAVHLYGNIAEIPKVGLPVIEDACEALGLIKPTAEFGAFSFYGNKVITTGEGGMLVGDVWKARPYRDGGFDSNYDMTHPGLNYRMTNLQAAIGCAQMERIDDLVQKRVENAEFYGQHLEGSGRWLFVARVENPHLVQQELKKHGIESRPVFRPLHLTQAFRQEGKYKRAVDLWEHGICLPTGPHVSQQELEQITESVRGYQHISGTSGRGSQLAA